MSMMLFTTFAQGVRFDANTVNVISNDNDKKTVKTECHFAFDLASYRLLYTDNSGSDYDERIIGVDTIQETTFHGKVVQIWSETSYFELHYTSSINEKSKTPKTMLLMEYPYIGEVQYRQYYMWKFDARPVQANN